MAEIHEGRRVRFRCHTGHAYSSVTLLADIDQSIDDNLWRALRALEERALLLGKLEREAESGDRQEEVAKSAQALADTRRRGDVLRRLLFDQQALGHELDEPK